jgi:hypothetical protein
MWNKTAVVALLITLFVPMACQHLTYRANQDKAESSMKALRTAETEFPTQKGRYGALEELIATRLINSIPASGIKDGYRFNVRVKENGFEATAVPLKYNESGSWSFYVDESNVIRGNVKEGREADASDPPLRYQ